MSARMFQSIAAQLKDVSGRTVGVIDGVGSVVACSDAAFLGSVLPGASAAVASAGASVICVQGFTLKAIPSIDLAFEYAAFVRGEDEQAEIVCALSTVAYTEAKKHYEEKYDKSAFVKSIITDNIMPGDIYVRARELNFPTDATRVVFLFNCAGGADATLTEMIRGGFADDDQDFVLCVSELDIALVKLVTPETDAEKLDAMALEMQKALRTAHSEAVVVGVGRKGNSLREIASSFKEAQTAIEIGRVFGMETDVVCYDNLGLGRLIYQLPTTLCEMFLDEVFKKNTIDSLDQETLFTINKFFENNLNVSEASRKLFVHRNTLVYRLEKIKKLTGLDLREFDHAIIFKVALMVRQYLDSKEL